MAFFLDDNIEPSSTHAMRLHSGELFYASGEVTVKAPQMFASSQAPRLGLFQSYEQRDGSQVALDLADGQQEVVKDKAQLDGEGAGVQDVGISLKEATSSMSLAEMRIAELTREAAEARFDSEDAQARHLEAQTKVYRPHRDTAVVSKAIQNLRRALNFQDLSIIAARWPSTWRSILSADMVTFQIDDHAPSWIKAALIQLRYQVYVYQCES